MAFSSHKGTAGHSIGKSIIGKDSGTPQPDVAQTQSGFSHISVKPASNGISVSHTPADKGNSSSVPGNAGVHPESPIQEQIHVFRSAEEAHHHIGQLLGVRMGSGAQQV